MISLSPSRTRASSSGESLPSRFPRRSVESVLIWPIFTHERFGSRTERSSSVNGNPAFGSAEVIASAITVPERWLKTSSLITSTGRKPACSWPRVGSRSAQTTSPLSTRATPAQNPASFLLQPVHSLDSASRTLLRVVCASTAPACRARLPESTGCGSLRRRESRARRVLRGRLDQSRSRSWRRACFDSITNGRTAGKSASAADHSLHRTRPLRRDSLRAVKLVGRAGELMIRRPECSTRACGPFH